MRGDDNIYGINKRNCLEVATSSLILAAGVILSVVLVSIMVTQFRQASLMTNAVSEEMSSQTQAIRNNDILQYDGLTVRGADVVNFYKKYFSDYGAGKTGWFSMEIDHTDDSARNGYVYLDGTYIDSLNDINSGHYVKPTGRWKGKVIKNDNGIITDVIFTIQ